MKATIITLCALAAPALLWAGLLWMASRPRRGVCRVCGCTEDFACPGGCAWADEEHTLCDRCLITAEDLRQPETFVFRGQRYDRNFVQGALESALEPNELRAHAHCEAIKGRGKCTCK